MTITYVPDTGANLTVMVNGYRVTQATGEDVHALRQAGMRFCTAQQHMPTEQPDMLEGDKGDLTNLQEVWIADTDRGTMSAWALNANSLIQYVASLPPCPYRIGTEVRRSGVEENA